MKHLIFLLPFMLTSCAFAQSSNEIHEWKATVKVTDELGIPVAQANVSIGYFTNNDTAELHGLTDTNGVFVATHTTSTYNYIEYKLAFVAGKDGYYGTRSGCDLGIPYDASKWNPTVNLLLKIVGKPIAMYARRVDEGPPVFNKPVGYDLAIGDWVAPHGKGLTTDIIFTGNLDKKSKNDFDYKLTVSFPKSGDGIQEFIVPDAEKGSGLRSPHEAPANGYQLEVVKTMSHHPGVGAKDDMNDPSRNYFFRVRTVKDSEGNIVSAHYGKIYGDFMQFTYYLNPTSNDRNIEFDPKQNLIYSLQSFEQASAP
jgi:hypothetical protein